MKLFVFVSSLLSFICFMYSSKKSDLYACSFAVVVSSSCSTDETIVADSEAEDETATSVRETAAAHSREVVETVNKMKAKEDCDAPNYVATFRPSRGSVPLKREADTESESGNLDVVCSQHLIVRDTSTRTASSTANNEAVNFKRFRKVMCSVSSICLFVSSILFSNWDISFIW